MVGDVDVGSCGGRHVCVEFALTRSLLKLGILLPVAVGVMVETWLQM